MKKPNFFIIGAPKCGTTSLSSWLQQHPAVFMSNPKEPGYFDTDLGRGPRFSTRDYEGLFRAASESHVAVGEGSTGYIRSRVAAKKILEYAADARFIVCIRNPIDMAVSLHGQLLREGAENITDFGLAWEAQFARRQGRKIPLLSDDPSKLIYGDVCSLGAQLERFFQEVPRDRVHIVIFDDLCRDPAAIYCEVLEFLGVSPDERSSLPVENSARTVPRFLSVSVALVREVKRMLGIHASFGLLNSGFVAQRLSRAERPVISAHLRSTLATYFERDVERLAGLVGRDLSSWCRSGGES